MEILGKILMGILIFTGGLLILKFRKQVKSFTGEFIWAEQWIGRGGTYLVIIAIGCFMIFLGVTYPFGGAEILFKR